MLFADCCLSVDVGCVLFVAWLNGLCVVRWLLFVVCRVLFVGCCLMFDV